MSVSLMNSADGPGCSRNMRKFPSCGKIYNTSQDMFGELKSSVRKQV